MDNIEKKYLEKENIDSILQYKLKQNNMTTKQIRKNTDKTIRTMFIGETIKLIEVRTNLTETYNYLIKNKKYDTSKSSPTQGH